VQDFFPTSQGSAVQRAYLNGPLFLCASQGGCIYFMLCTAENSPGE
jgi:hypothetical protein